LFLIILFTCTLFVESKRLNARINGIISTHQEKSLLLCKKHFRQSKRPSVKAQPLPLVYVDKLEGISSFAVAWDSEVREKKVLEIRESTLSSKAGAAIGQVSIMRVNRRSKETARGTSFGTLRCAKG
jgi:hypothetical protein